MGGPKATLRVGATPILGWLHDRLAWRGRTMVVIGNGMETPPGADRFDQCVADPAGGEGPLRGILTALERATDPSIVVTAVDMPQIDASKLLWALEALGAGLGRFGVMARVGAMIEPFPSAYSQAARPAIERRLAQARRSVHGLCEEPCFAAIDAPADWNPRTWTNLNDPASLTQFLESQGAKLT